MHLTHDEFIVLGGSSTERDQVLSIRAPLTGRDLLHVEDLTAQETRALLETAARLKRLRHCGDVHAYLHGKTLALILRSPVAMETRLDWEAGMAQLGGTSTVLQADFGHCRGHFTGLETAVALSRSVHSLVVYSAQHCELVELATAVTIPVINAGSDCFRPLAAIADVFTLQEQFGTLTGLKLLYLGEADSMFVSLLAASAAVGINVEILPQTLLGISDVAIHRARIAMARSEGVLLIATCIEEAARKADAIYFGAQRKMVRAGATAVTAVSAHQPIMAKVSTAARPGIAMMRGQSPDSCERDGNMTFAEMGSLVLDQAENRLHVSKAVLVHTLGEGRRGQYVPLMRNSDQ